MFPDFPWSNINWKYKLKIQHKSFRNLRCNSVVNVLHTWVRHLNSVPAVHLWKRGGRLPKTALLWVRPFTVEHRCSLCDCRADWNCRSQPCLASPGSILPGKKKKIQTQNTENIFYWIHTAFAPSESLKIIKVSPDTPGIFRTINRVTFLTPEDLRRHPFLSSLWYSPVCSGTQTTYIPFLREGYAWETQGIVFIVLIPCNWK